MTGIVSTVPGAIATLETYMTAIASANPGLNLGVYGWGLPTAAVTNNFIALGDPETGEATSEVDTEWAALGGAAKLRSEAYSLLGTIRASGGVIGQQGAQERMTDAYTIFNALHEQVVSDIGGSGSLSPSGSWGGLTNKVFASGPFGPSGWMVVLRFELHVINAQLIG